jgi:hypothetical protein
VNDEGPHLDSLTHRLSECPPEFLLEPRVRAKGTIDVAAIVCDLLRRLKTDGPLDHEAYIANSIGSFALPRQQLIAIVAWLMHDSWFLDRPQFAPGVRQLILSSKLADLSNMVRSETVVGDPDRREELVRVCLSALGLRPRGESIAQATDRLNTLDSVERKRVVEKTRAAEARARQIREAMARPAAQEAAARYSPE